MAHSQAPSNGDSIDTTKEAFVELCRELNMDFESQDTAWASYKKIDQNYVLEVCIKDFIVRKRWNYLLYLLNFCIFNLKAPLSSV